MPDQSPLSHAAFTPTEAERRSLLEWFERYDTHHRAHRIEAMAEMALFPVIVMTDDSAGECVTRQWDRETYLKAMRLADQGVDQTSMELRNHRQPVFLSPDLAVVVTDSTVTLDGVTHHMRYVDVMAKADGEWKFKCMIQTGWGDMLKQFRAA